jgi:hypothetical protein
MWRTPKHQLGSSHNVISTAGIGTVGLHDQTNEVGTVSALAEGECQLEGDQINLGNGKPASAKPKILLQRIQKNTELNQSESVCLLSRKSLSALAF